MCKIEAKLPGHFAQLQRCVLLYYYFTISYSNNLKRFFINICNIIYETVSETVEHIYCTPDTDMNLLYAHCARNS